MGIRTHNRNDRAIGEITQTPQGGYRIPGAVGRVGVLKYRRPDGSIRREYRPPEEVFHPDSLASLRSAPVTRGHPPEKINPANFKKYVVGHFEGDPIVEDDTYVAGTILVQDGSAIEGINQGEDELSGGYDSRTDYTPGVSPEGEEYDVVQRHIRYNHVAIVPKGRAGSEVSLRLDAEDNEIPDEPGSKSEWKMDPQKLMEENAMLKAKIAELEAKLGTTDAAKTDAQKRADEATASAAEAAKNLEEGTSPEKLDTLVEERTDAIDAFLSVCPKGRENEIKGKPTKTIREMALKLVDPEFKTDGADPEAEIRGAFKLAFSKRKGNSADLRRGAAAARLGMGDIETRKDSIETEPSSSDARKKMIEANRQASQGKLSAHK